MHPALNNPLYLVLLIVWESNKSDSRHLRETTNFYVRLTPELRSPPVENQRLSRPCCKPCDQLLFTFSDRLVHEASKAGQAARVYTAYNMRDGTPHTDDFQNSFFFFLLDIPPTRGECKRTAATCHLRQDLDEIFFPKPAPLCFLEKIDPEIHFCVILSVYCTSGRRCVPACNVGR